MKEGIDTKILSNIMDKTKNSLPADNAAIFNLKDIANERIVSQAAQVLMCCNATLMTRAVEGKQC